MIKQGREPRLNVSKFDAVGPCIIAAIRGSVWSNMVQIVVWMEMEGSLDMSAC